MPKLRAAFTLTIAAAVLIASSASSAGDHREINASQPAQEVVQPHEPRLSVTGTRMQHTTVGRVAATFADIGLILPDVAIRFWDDDIRCGGHMGLFRPSQEGWTIEICSATAFVLPHELGHAWERATLTDVDRSTYLDERGLDAWLSDDRTKSGLEDVAFVIQLVVLGEGSSSRRPINEAFTLLRSLTSPTRYEASVHRARISSGRE